MERKLAKLSATFMENVLATLAADHCPAVEEMGEGERGIPMWCKSGTSGAAEATLLAIHAVSVCAVARA
jgi:hypothetical protein